MPVRTGRCFSRDSIASCIRERGRGTEARPFSRQHNGLANSLRLVGSQAKRFGFHMPDYARLILKYFAQPEARPRRPKELQALLRVKQSQASPFRAAVEELVESGQLHRSTNGTVSLPRP